MQISKDMELIESQTVNIQREASNIKKSKKYIKELLLINDHLQKKQDIQSNNLNIRKIIKYRIKKLFIKLNIYDLYFLLRYQKINPIKKLKKINLPPEKILYDQLSENIKKVCDQINFKELKQVTIIIPVYGKWDYTIRCLDSLYKIKTKYNFEVIIMDDNSKSLPPDVIMQNSNKDNKNIVYYKNNKNLGFIKNCNKGSELANGKYIVFLNNDTHVFEDWLDELIMTFDKKDDVGIVGSKIIYENQKLQEAGGIIWNDGTGMNFGKGDIQSHPRYNYIKEVDYVSGCSLAIKKSLFIETGKFDDDLQVAYYEDAAKCFQIRDQGYKVIYQPKSVLVHYEGVTNGKDTTSGIKSYQEVNRSIFKKKYLSNRKHSYYDYQKYKNEKNIRLANEIYKKERILIIDNCIPTPDLDEGSLYMWNLIKFLKNDSNLVKFIPAEELHEARSNYFENMRQIGVECAALPHYSSVKNFIIEHKDVFTKAIITRVNNCDNYINIVRKYNKSIKIIFNTIDLHHLREMRQAKIEDNKSIKSQAEYMKKIEMNCIEKSDVTVVVSEEEKSYLITEGIDKNKIEVLPLLREANNFDIAPYDERENKIIFIGNFNHQPNVDGINYFLENIYPYVSTKLKSFKNIEIELEIIGSNMPAELQKKIKDSKLNVTYRGYVKNLNNILSKAKLSIAPLRYGAGLKGKIISSFENGLPVLGSKVAFEGISIDSLTKNTELIVENEDEYFLSISKLLFDKDEWNNISKKLKNIVTKNYSVKSNTSKIQKIIY